MQQIARRANLLAFFELGVVAHDHHSDLSLIEVQRETGDAMAKIDHFVEHCIAETFDSRHAVADLADDANILFGGRGFRSNNLRFNFH